MVSSYALPLHFELQSFSRSNVVQVPKTKCVKKALRLFLYKSVSSARMYSPKSACKNWEKINSADFVHQSAPGGMQQCSWGPRACTPRWLLQPPQTQWAGQPCCARSHPGTWGGQEFEGSNLQKCSLWSVLRDPAQPTFHNVMPIQELLLCRSFHPDLREKF